MSSFHMAGRASVGQEVAYDGDLRTATPGRQVERAVVQREYQRRQIADGKFGIVVRLWDQLIELHREEVVSPGSISLGSISPRSCPAASCSDGARARTPAPPCPRARR
ncbi:MAG TPA: hypothetical protein VF711_13880, partial [Acidimicrobiales bacterium]